MDDGVSFLLLIVLGLSIWALVRTYKIEAALRDYMRRMEELASSEDEPLEPPALSPGAARTPMWTPPVPRTYTPPATELSQGAEAFEPAAVAETKAVTAPEVPRAETRPLAPQTALRPTEWQQLFAFITGGNIFVRIGVLVLFFGVGFLLKYASEHHALPPQLRLLGSTALAFGLFGVGWHLRHKTRNYALVLQGGGIGILYLTVFAALRLYHLLPGGAVFLLLCIIVVASGALAVLQDALWLALMAALGGFLAPVLASTGGGSHVVLFSYYLLLSIGIFGVALYRSWRSLNVLAFVCTFIIASAWGALRYTPELFPSTEPFLIAFFLLYTAIALVYALRQSVRLMYYADGALIFGVPLVGFGLQSAMVNNWQYALAWSALGLAGFYSFLALAVQKFRGASLRILVEAFMALGAGFATLAIPLAFDAYWTSAAWALEGAGIAWTGMRQRRNALVYSGLLLQFAAGIAFLLQGDTHPAQFPVINSQTLGSLFISLAGLFSAWYLERIRADGDDKHHYGPLSIVMLCWGGFWWVQGGIREVTRLCPWDPAACTGGLLLFASASLLLFSSTARALRWRTLGLIALLQTPVMAALLLAFVALAVHPIEDWGWLAWGLALPASFFILRQLESYDAAKRLLPIWHALNLLVSLMVITWECDWRLPFSNDAVWHVPAAGALPAAVLLLLTLRGRAWLPWPVGRFAGAYVGIAGAVIAVHLWIWLLYSNVVADSHIHAMFAYVPVCNPLDAAQILAALALGLWLRSVARGDAEFGLGEETTSRIPHYKGIALTCLVGVAFFGCINGMLIRTLCYWLPLPFEWHPLMDSQVVQMSLSILWTVSALGITIFAARARQRLVWFTGAALMLAEVVKLFIIDLAGAGSLERIVSFIVVGVLLLLIGYFSPLPPATRDA